MTYVLIITIPMLFVWVVVVLDIAGRPDLPLSLKCICLLGVTVVWPTMILYLLARPVQGRLLTATQVRRANPDPRQQLVEAVLEHRAQRIGEEAFEARLRRLRDGYGS